MTQDDIRELKDIQRQMADLLCEADHLIRCGTGYDITYDRWHGYVYSHIIMALQEEHEFLGGSMFTFEGIIQELEESEADEPEEDDEE